MPNDLTPLFVLLFGGYVLFGLFQASGNRVNAQTSMMNSYVKTAEKNADRISALEGKTEILEVDLLATAKQLAADREKDLQKAREDLNRRTKELDDRTIELRTASARIADLDAKIDALTGTVRVLEDRIRVGDEKHLTEIRRLTEERNQLLTEKTTLEVENRQLKITIEDLKRQISNLETRVLSLEARNSQNTSTQDLIDRSNALLAKRASQTLPAASEGGTDGKG